MADFTTTISDDRVSPLSNDERAVWGVSHKFRVLSSDIALASATGSTDTVTVTLGASPTRWFVNRAFGYVNTAFAGTTALTVEAGTTTSVAAFISSQSVLTGGAILTGVATLPEMTNATATASRNLQLKFTNATGGSPSALTAGEATFYVNLCDSTTLP